MTGPLAGCALPPAGRGATGEIGRFGHVTPAGAGRRSPAGRPCLAGNVPIVPGSREPDDLEEFVAECRVGPDRAEQCGGDCFAAGGVHAADGHAHVFGADDDANAGG